MTTKAAKVLVVLGVLGCAFTAFAMFQLYGAYRSNDLPLILGSSSVGVLLLAIGLGSWKRPLAGIAAFGLGGAAVAGCLLLTIAKHERQMIAIHGEIDVMRVAEAVCRGTPNAAAADTAGQRAVLQVITRPSETGGPPVAIPAAWQGLRAPTTVSEVQLVVCRHADTQYVTSCSYQGKGPAGGSMTITKAKAIDKLTIRDAKTAAVIAEQTFEGGAPSDLCDKSVVVGPSSKSYTTTGDAPSEADETAFVRKHLAAAER